MPFFLMNVGGGCTDGLGVVFELSPSPGGIWTGKLLHNFVGDPDGSKPYGDVILDGAGNLCSDCRWGCRQRRCRV
jgi:hypothetical protein